MKLLCNPLEIAYKYQHPLHGKYAYREAADPTIVRFNGKYLLFTSKCGGFYYSDDLFVWGFHEDRTLEIHGYAPDVSVRGEWLYFCAKYCARKIRSRALRSSTRRLLSGIRICISRKPRHIFIGAVLPRNLFTESRWMPKV